MGLVTLKYVLNKAKKGGFAIGSFNCFGLETIQGIISGAKAMNSPVIVQTSMSSLEHIGEKTAVGMVRGIADDFGVPVVLHLDHSDNVELTKRCIDNGYTSVMIDGSKKTFEENIRMTAEVVEYASRVGCSVEAELGHVTMNSDNISMEEREKLFTEPDKAREFVERTGCDALAIAVGTAHGFYKLPPKLDFNRIKEIHNQIPDTALVLHGGTGVSEDDLIKAITLGISKINIGTEIWFKGYGNVVREEAMKMPLNSDARIVMATVRDACKAIVEHKIEVFGSANSI